MLYKECKVFFDYCNFAKLSCIGMNDLEKELNWEILRKMELLCSVPIDVILREQQKKDLGDLQRIQIRTDLLHKSLIKLASRVIRQVATILVVFRFTTIIAALSLRLFLLLLTGLLRFGLRRRVLALKNCKDHFSKSSHHELCSLLREKHEAFEEYV